MTFQILRSKVVEIVKDIGLRTGEPVMNVANDAFRKAIAERRNTQPYLLSHDYWIIGEPEDFAKAAEATHAYFSVETGERILARETWRESLIVLRPGAIWMEGKKFRVELITMTSYHDSVRGLIWRAALTEYGKLSLWGWRHPDTKKKLIYENASEHAAQKSMRELFENLFDLRLDSV